MDNRPILFLDSGIGGIPYCRHFIRNNPQESVCYLADRAHFPYGTRGREELAAILTAIMEKCITAVNPKIAVLACNTATISALAELRRLFPQLLFVGTVPAIKPAMLAAKTGKVGVLGTERTIQDPYINGLAGTACQIIGIAAPELVEFVENDFLNAGKEEKSKMARLYIDKVREAGADTLVLGCTHFLFLLDEFREEAEPSIKIFDSIDGISHRVESLLNENNSALRAPPADSSSPPKNTLLLTGKDQPDTSWQTIADDLCFTLSLLDKT
jgi:glutamate racemase